LGLGPTPTPTPTPINCHILNFYKFLLFYKI